MRGVAVALALAFAAMVGVAGCGRRASGPTETPVEARLRAAIGEVVGTPVARVACDKPAAAPAHCVARIDGVDLPVAVRDIGADLAWDIDGMVVRGPAVATEVAAMLDELGVTATIECGARIQVVSPGARVECEIRAATRAGSAVADTGRAWATIAADGTAELELALGAEAVTARTAEVATSDLDALSRALDTEGGGDEDGDGDGVPADGDAAPADGDAAPADAAPDAGN